MARRRGAYVARGCVHRTTVAENAESQSCVSPLSLHSSTAVTRSALCSGQTRSRHPSAALSTVAEMCTPVLSLSVSTFFLPQNPLSADCAHTRLPRYTRGHELAIDSLSFPTPLIAQAESSPSSSRRRTTSRPSLPKVYSSSSTAGSSLLSSSLSPSLERVLPLSLVPPCRSHSCHGPLLISPQISSSLPTSDHNSTPPRPLPRIPLSFDSAHAYSQDACGIVTCGPKGRFYQCKGNGMVRDLLDAKSLNQLIGGMGVGHGQSALGLEKKRDKLQRQS